MAGGWNALLSLYPFLRWKYPANPPAVGFPTKPSGSAPLLYLLMVARPVALFAGAVYLGPAY